MVRRWFSIAGVLAIVGVMLAADASQAGPLQRLRDRLRGRNVSEEGSSRFGFRRSFFRNAEPAVTSTQVALDIRVPANAEVWVNDSKISQTGTLRTFTAENLTAGQTYSYKIKAQWDGQGGKKVTKERTIEARPGQRMMVDLTRTSSQRTAPEELKQPKESNGSKEKD